MVWVLQVMPRPMDSRKSRLRTSAENQRLRVELEALCAEIDELRRVVYEYVDCGSSHLETGQPR